jgi:hypothetical protein
MTRHLLVPVTAVAGFPEGVEREPFRFASLAVPAIVALSRTAGAHEE